MSGRDSGRGGRGGYGDRDSGRGNFREGGGGGGNFRDRDRAPRPPGGPPSRPWERRDDDRPPRPAGDRPFDRPAGPPPDRDVRVERYFPEESDRPPRMERGGIDRPARFGGDREGGGRFGGDVAPRPRPAPAAERPVERPTPAPAPRAEEPKGAAAAAARPTPQGWSQAHLMDSWLDEQRLKGWTPGDQDQQEMVEDNIEADPQVPGRDGRAISVQARSGVVTLTGTVRSRAVKFAAGSDAYWTYGVNAVKNELVVKPRGPQVGETSAPKRPTATVAPEPVAAVVAAQTSEAELPATLEELVTAENEAAVEVIEEAPAAPKRASRRKVASEASTDD